MAKRLFENNGEWTSEASRCCNEITILLKDALNLLEEELGTTIDLKDYHYVANHAIGGFVSDLSIRRRLVDSEARPKELMGNYPRLNPFE